MTKSIAVLQEDSEAETGSVSRRQLIAGGMSTAICALYPAPTEAVLLRILWRLALRVVVRNAVRSIRNERTIFRSKTSPTTSRIYRPDPERIAPGFHSLHEMREIVHAHPSIIAVSSAAMDRIQRHGVIALWVNDMLNFFAIDYENPTDRAVAGDLYFELRDLDTGESTRVGSFPMALQAHAKGHLPAHDTHWWQNPCITGIRSPGAKVIRPYFQDEKNVEFQEIGPVYVAGRNQIQKA